MLKMKKVFKLMSFVLVMALLVVSTPISANAASVTYLEITRDNAPLRKEAHDEGKIVARCEEGAVLKSTGSFYNYKFRKWHRVEYQGSTYYIYSGNVATHTHDYEELYYGGTTYKYCDCGQVNVVSTTTKYASETIASYASAAGLAIGLDGPAPIGDIVGAAIIMYTACYLATNGLSDVVIDVLEEIDVDEFLDDRENECSAESFRKVSRVGGTLTYIDNQCMDEIQAFFYVMLVGDVYNYDEQNAEELAALYGSYFKDKDKDKPSYWWHFHLGNDHKSKVKGHIFFGTNDYGMYPISLTY